MAKEPDNLVLQLLREMRATLDGHTTEFKKLNRQIDDWAQTSAQASSRHRQQESGTTCPN